MTGNYKYEDLFVEQTEQHIAIDYIGSNQSSLFLFKVQVNSQKPVVAIYKTEYETQLPYLIINVQT